MATSTTRKLVEKVTARVFCQLEGGGNPVTIFKSQSPLKPATQARLAASCEWESVCISTNATSTGNATKTQQTQMPSMAFYMPTGEQVSFCAHAAMGGVLQLGSQTPEQPLQFTATALSATTVVDDDDDDDDDTDNNNNNNNNNDITPTPYTAIVHEHDIVSLEMETDFTETAVPHRPTLHRILRDCCGLESSDLAVTAAAGPNSSAAAAAAAAGGASSSSYTSTDPPTPVQVPTFCNSSIARPKTLIYVNSVQALHRAKPPAPNTAHVFRVSCDAIESTGLYLYAPVIDTDNSDSDHSDHSKDKGTMTDSWECRQFPRASGYPEDPATGIAAAALAASLWYRGNKLPAYKFYQGTAMGTQFASLIMVENMNISKDEDDDKDTRKNRASFRLLGRIEVDQSDEIEVDDE